MDKKFAPAILGAVILFVTTVLLPSSASAAGAPAPAGDPAARSAAPACHVTPKSGVSAVNVRLRTNTDSTRLGTIQPGERAPAACDAVEGGSYTACGSTSRWWIPVTWGGRTGYVAARCVDWFS